MRSNIGELDRRITIRRNTATVKNRIGEAVPVWTVLATVWAAYAPISDGEKMLATEQFASLEARFVIRWSTGVADVNAKDQITFDNREWNILGVKETERRRWIEISAGTRNER